MFYGFNHLLKKQIFDLKFSHHEALSQKVHVKDKGCYFFPLML